MIDFRFGFGGILGRRFPVFARFLFVCAVFVAAGFGYRVLAADPSSEEFYGQNQDDTNQDQDYTNQDQRDEYDGEGDNADEAALPAGGVLSLEAWNEFLSNNNNERPSLPSPPPLRSFTVDDLGVPYATGYAGRVSAEMTVRAPVISGLTTPAQASFMCDGDGGYFGWSLSAVQGQCLVGGVPVTATRDHFAVDGDLSGMNFSYGQEKKYKVFSDTGDVATSESAVDDIGITGATNDHMFTIMRGKQGFFQYTPEYISDPPAGAPAMTYKTYMLWLDNTSGDDLMIPSGPGETAGGDLIFKDFRQFAQRAPSDLITVERACTPLEVTVCPPPGTPIAGICGSLSATTNRLQASDTNLDIIRTAADGEACAAGVLDQASVSQNMAMSTDERFVAQWRCNGIDGGDPSVLCTASRVIDDIECPDISRSVTPVTAGDFMMQTDTNNNMYCPLGSGTLEYDYNPIDPATYPNADGSPATQGRYTCSKAFAADGRRVETPICTAPLLVPDIIPSCGSACDGIEFKNQGQFQSACGDAATLCAPATGTELMVPVEFVQILNSAPPEFDVSWTCMPAYGGGSSSRVCTATIRPDALSLCGTAMSDNTQVFYTEAQLQASPNLCTNGGTPTAMPTQVGSTNTYEWNCPDEASACSKTLTLPPECASGIGRSVFDDQTTLAAEMASNPQRFCAQTPVASTPRLASPVQVLGVDEPTQTTNVAFECVSSVDSSLRTSCSTWVDENLNEPQCGVASRLTDVPRDSIFTVSELCDNGVLSASSAMPTPTAPTYSCAVRLGAAAENTVNCQIDYVDIPALACADTAPRYENYAAFTASLGNSNTVDALCQNASSIGAPTSPPTAAASTFDYTCANDSGETLSCPAMLDNAPTCTVPSDPVDTYAALTALPVTAVCSAGSTPIFVDNGTTASWQCDTGSRTSSQCSITFQEPESTPECGYFHESENFSTVMWLGTSNATGFCKAGAYKEDSSNVGVNNNTWQCVSDNDSNAKINCEASFIPTPSCPSARVTYTDSSLFESFATANLTSVCNNASSVEIVSSSSSEITYRCRATTTSGYIETAECGADFISTTPAPTCGVLTNRTDLTEATQITGAPVSQLCQAPSTLVATPTGAGNVWTWNCKNADDVVTTPMCSVTIASVAEAPTCGALTSRTDLTQASQVTSALESQLCQSPSTLVSAPIGSGNTWTWNCKNADDVITNPSCSVTVMPSTDAPPTCESDLGAVSWKSFRDDMDVSDLCNNSISVRKLGSPQDCTPYFEYVCKQSPAGAPIIESGVCRIDRSPASISIEQPDDIVLSEEHMKEQHRGLLSSLDSNWHHDGLDINITTQGDTDLYFLDYEISEIPEDWGWTTASNGSYVNDSTFFDGGLINANHNVYTNTSHQQEVARDEIDWDNLSEFNVSNYYYSEKTLGEVVFVAANGMNAEKSYNRFMTFVPPMSLTNNVVDNIKITARLRSNDGSICYQEETDPISVIVEQEAPTCPGSFDLKLHRFMSNQSETIYQKRANADFLKNNCGINLNQDEISTDDMEVYFKTVQTPQQTYARNIISVQERYWLKSCGEDSTLSLGHKDCPFPSDAPAWCNTNTHNHTLTKSVMDYDHSELCSSSVKANIRYYDEETRSFHWICEGSPVSRCQSRPDPVHSCGNIYKKQVLGIADIPQASACETGATLVGSISNQNDTYRWECNKAGTISQCEAYKTEEYSSVVGERTAGEGSQEFFEISLCGSAHDKIYQNKQELINNSDNFCVGNSDVTRNQTGAEYFSGATTYITDAYGLQAYNDTEPPADAYLYETESLQPFYNWTCMIDNGASSNRSSCIAYIDN